VGQLGQIGLAFDFSETPGRIQGPPLIVGDRTRAILTSVGYTQEEVDLLCAEGVALEAGGRAR
jgi:crotonobetainyl-CoA:carnitine CoA-transferase CaiB-like acyl-CoA transferase